MQTEKTEKIDKITERIEVKLDEALKAVQLKPISLHTGWFYGHRYGDLATFTGRAEELKMLSDWLDNDKENLLIIRALGGFGKSALTWQWFNNKVDREKWTTAIWWSFYEKESGFESFLTEALTHLGIETKERSSRQQVNDLLDAMQSTNILIVLDGFERLLRQYRRMDTALQSDDEDMEIDPSQRDCTSMSAETFLRGLVDEKIRSKVLMTTRLFPRVLEGTDGKILKACREENLKAFSPEDAVMYFHNEGIAATRAEIIEICSAYGYHPLSLSLLVGLINENEEHRGDIVVARNLDIFGDIKAKRDHVLKRAYESLSPERRDLLSKISCFRGSMEYATIKKVFDNPDLEKSLIDLRKRGLLQYVEETKRYDMNPIVRHYAYDHLTADKKREAHVKLAMHFIDVMPVTNTKVKTLEDLAPVIELYHHMVGAGNLDEALKLFYDRLHNTLYYQFGAYQIVIELLRALFLDGEDKPPRLNDESAQAWTLDSLANTYALSGQPRRAIPLLEKSIDLEKKRNNQKNLAVRLKNLASMAQFPIGALSGAERNLRRSIEICLEMKETYTEGASRAELSRLLSYDGLFSEAEKEFPMATELFEKGIDNNQSTRLLTYGGLFDEAQGKILKSISPFQFQLPERSNDIIRYDNFIWAYRSLCFLLMARDQINSDQSSGNALASAMESAKNAFELTNEQAKEFPIPRDYVRIYWLLGVAYRMKRDLTLAEENLSKALNLCRQINLVEMEADILLDIARLRYAQGDFKDAQEKASEALTITERSGYVLQGADVNLFLAQLALTPTPLPEGEGDPQGQVREIDKAKAKQYAEQAKKLATCDGPPYYYKVAYEEAERMLEKLRK